jgi:hypothetical protein
MVLPTMRSIVRNARAALLTKRVWQIAPPHPEEPRIARRLEGWAATKNKRQVFSIPRLVFARVVQSRRSLFVPRAQGKPGADCARSAVCKKTGNNAHGFDRYSRDIPAFPAQWVYGLYVLSPVSGLCLSPLPQPPQGGGDRRQGRGARTTRFRRPPVKRFVQVNGSPDASQRPSHPAPNET